MYSVSLRSHDLKTLYRTFNVHNNWILSLVIVLDFRDNILFLAVILRHKWKNGRFAPSENEPISQSLVYYDTTSRYNQKNEDQEWKSYGPAI